MPIPTVRARRAVALVLAGSCLALAGCSGSTKDGGETPGPTAPSGAPTLAQVVPATDDLGSVSCKHGDGGWSFSGKIKNSGEVNKDYTVTVRIVPDDNKQATVGLTTVKKTVPAGKTVDFVAKNFSKLPSKGNSCTPIATKDA